MSDLKSLSRLGKSKPEIYGDFAYKFKNIMEKTDQFRNIIIHNKRIGYNLNVLRQSVFLVINPITVDNFAALFNCTPVNRVADSMMARPKFIQFSWLGPDLSSQHAVPVESLLLFLHGIIP